MLRIVTFGGLRIELDAVLVTGAAARRRPLALLAILAAFGARGVSRDRISALLWPESDAERARNVLKQTIYSLRRDLGMEELVSGAQDLRLDPASCSCDLWEFEAALKDGDVDAALALWTGPFLDGFHLDVHEFTEWAEGERRRLEALAAKALEQAAAAARGRGDVLVALEHWKRRAALDPFDTRVAGQLIEAWSEAGDSVAAARHVRVHEALVREELGREPDGRLRALLERLDAKAAAPRAHLPARDMDVVASPRIPEPRDNAVTLDAQHASHRPPRRWPLRAIAAGVLFMLALGTWGVRTQRGNAAATRGATVLVVPFRTTAAASDLAYLQHGLVDLVATGLSSGDAVQVVDAHTALAALGAGTSISTEHARSTALKLGADFTVTGAVIGDSRRLQITTVLRDSTGREVAAVVVGGAHDSLPHLVDRVVSQLFGAVMGEPARSRSALARHPVSAVRAYVEGRAAYRQGRWPEAIASFRAAVQADSTFALASIGLVSAAIWIGDTDARAFGERLAWNARHELSTADRSYLEALTGPNYPERPSSAVRLAAWERATRLSGDRPEVWFALGDDYFHKGALLGIDEPMRRAAAAFERALKVAPAYSAALVHLIQVRALQRDNAAVRALAPRLDHVASSNEQLFGRWRIARALSQVSALDSTRRAFARTDDESLRAVALTEMYEGGPLHDAERALTVLLNRSADPRARRNVILGQHALAQIRGDAVGSARALSALSSLDPSGLEAARFAVLDALYGVGSADAAFRAATALERSIGRPTSTEPQVDRCVLGQWRSSKSDTTQVRATIAELTASTTDDAVVRTEAVVCARLLDASLAVARGDGRAPTLLVALDSLLSTGPALRASHPYMSIAVARLHARLGDSASALAAVRRRGWFGRWPHYERSHREFEAMLTGLTAPSPRRTASSPLPAPATASPAR